MKKKTKKSTLEGLEKVFIELDGEGILTRGEMIRIIIKEAGLRSHPVMVCFEKAIRSECLPPAAEKHTLKRGER